MFSAQQYVKATSLQQALELNQKRSSTILGGGCWMRLGKKNYATLIDLSGLGLDTIEETPEEIVLGAMVTLRQLETSPVLAAAFGPLFARMTEHIVGVQFRNCATLGGSVVSRFGFSDIITGLLALDCEVELVQKGRVSLADYVQMPYDRDVLARVILKKNGRRAWYESFRNTETDLPVLNCAVSCLNGSARVVVGARPARAVMQEFGQMPSEQQLQEMLDKTEFGSNMRAGAEYRRQLAGVLCRRAIEQVKGDAECR